MNKLLQYAPIALFTYNRPDKTKTVIESLLKNAEAKDSDVFIFSDGPKNEKAFEGVKANREYIHQVQESSRELKWFRKVTVIEHEKNCGLSNSLIAGITELTDKYGKVIVVEDDLVLSPYFLKFMNDGLNKYEKDDKVSAISGFLSPIDCEVVTPFFLRYFDCWGWATWKRSWDLFNPDVRDLLKQLRWKKNDFNIGGSGPFYGHLYCHKVGLVDTWAARFYASSFLADKLVLFPTKTMTVQIGFDGSGVHCGDHDSVYNKMKLADSPQEIPEIPVEESKEMYNAYHRFLLQGKENFTFHDKYCQFKSFVRRLLGLDHR